MTNIYDIDIFHPLFLLICIFWLFIVWRMTEYIKTVYEPSYEKKRSKKKMKIVEWLKEQFFQITHDPNSPKGLRHRAERLIQEGYSQNNPYVQALLKQAKLKEKEKCE